MPKRSTRRPLSVLGLCVIVGACGGGGAERRPSASAADARLADSAQPTAPAASALVQQGEAALGQNDAAGAKTLFQQALAENPQDARASLDLGIASEMLGDGAGAEQAYRAAL